MEPILTKPGSNYHCANDLSTYHPGERWDWNPFIVRSGLGSYLGWTTIQALEGQMDRQSDLDNHADQLNPNNDAYWESRDWDERPDDWDERVERGDTLPDDD